MNHRNSELQDFVSEYVDSLLAWDIVVLLHHNQDRFFTAAEMSKLLCRPVSDIGPLLVRLRSKGMITPGSPFSAKPEFHEIATEFVAALADKRERLRILGDVLARQSGTLLSA